MAFINHPQTLNVKSELDLFSTLPIQSGVDSGSHQSYRPLTSLSNNGPIEFVVSGSNNDEYVDLARVYIHVQARLTVPTPKATTAVPEPTVPVVGPTNNWLHSMFSQVDVFLNQKCVTPPNNCYSYRAYLETLLNYSEPSKSSHLTANLFYDDTADKMDNIDAANVGFTKRREFTQGMILPKKDQSAMNTSKLNSLKLNSPVETSTNTNSKSGGAVKLQLCDIQSTATMKCTAIDVFHALMKPEMFVAFTNGSGRIDPKVGGTFEIFGGNVHGKIVDIDAPTKIVQLWRFKSWPDGHYSTVTFSIQEKEDSTHILVEQKGVPTSDVEKTKEGWDQYYWDAMKRTFGFGSYIL